MRRCGLAWRPVPWCPAPWRQIARSDWLRTVRDTPLGRASGAIRSHFPPTCRSVVCVPRRAGSEQGSATVYYRGRWRHHRPRPASPGSLAPERAHRAARHPWIASVRARRRQSITTTPSRSTAPDSAGSPARPVPRREIAVVDDETGLLLYGPPLHRHVRRCAGLVPPKSPPQLVRWRTPKSLDATVRRPFSTSLAMAAAGSARPSWVCSLVSASRLRTFSTACLLPSGHDAAEQLARSVRRSQRPVRHLG